MAYAAVISLKHTILNPINNIQIPTSSHLELVSLCSTLERLDDKRNSNIDRSGISKLDAKIREAAYKLEDVIQAYVLHHSLPPSDSQANVAILPVHMDDLKKEIDLFFETVKKLKEKYASVLDNPLPVDDDVSSTHEFGGNDEINTVGLSDQIEKIRHELLDLEPGPKTVSLFGMAGIGKTHIAREIYQQPVIVQHFKFKAWVRVGQKRKMKDTLVDIVAQMEGKPRSSYVGKDVYDLAVLFHKSTHDGRYLIVLDDVWSKEAGDFLRDWLPGVGDGRRVLLTTRREEVAEYDSTGIHQIRFLNKEESWDLLRKNVFDDENYLAPQLEEVGRKIAEKCEGLPLLILAVARMLREHDKTEEFWKKVVEDKTTTFTDAYDEISKVLYSSYEYLPQHLKPCFLYMGVFPQTSVIILPKLLNLWIAEDFFKRPIIESYDYITLEKFAMECLKKLVSNSVVIVCKHRSDFRIKSCKLHSAYWHLCAKEAMKEKLFHVLKKLNDDSEEYIESQRRLSIQNNILFGIEKVYNSMAATSTARSLLCTGPDHEYPVPICLNLVLLKVLDAVSIRFYEFPVAVAELLWLKYLSLTYYGKIPCSISNLQQLQCLILRRHHNIRFIRKLDSIRLPEEMRDEIRDMYQIWSTKLAGDSACLAKEIWEMICDIQQVWRTAELRYPTCLTKNIWMELWKLKFDEQQLWIIATGKNFADSWKTMSRMQLQWIAELLRDSPCFPNGIWDAQLLWIINLPRDSISLLKEMWRMVSHMQQLWSNKFFGDSTCFPKEIWVEIWEKVWDIQQVWSTKLQRDSVSLVKEIWEEMWNMQEVRRTKLPSDSTFLPKEIWEMRELRYLRIIGRNLPDPSYGANLSCLSTLYMDAESCTYSVFNGLAHLKKLGIKIELQPDDDAETLSCFKHISLLYSLESLKCVVVNAQLIVAPPDHLSYLPCSLKKLSLNGLGYGWESISAIGSLPKLQVLKLRCSAFRGPEWETKAKEFTSLEFLLLEDIDLVRWRIEEDGCFRRLKRLIIGHCYKLKKLPGAIKTLKTMEVVDCSPSVVAYAQQIKDAHPSVEVVITSSWKLRR